MARATQSDESFVGQTGEIRLLCDWALSVFGRIRFSATFDRMSSGAAGFALLDSSSDVLEKVQATVMEQGNAGKLVEHAEFVAVDTDDRFASIKEDLVDSDAFEVAVRGLEGRQYVICVRISGGTEGDISRCIRWAMVTDEVV